MIKFDEKKMLENGEYIYSKREDIEEIADKLTEKGFENILFTSSGGSIAMMQPFEYMIKTKSKIPVYSEISAELLLTGNSQITDKSIAFLASKSGDTKETVEAAKYLKEKGVTTISIIGKENSILEELSTYSVVYKDGRPQELILYILIGKLLNNNHEFKDYDKFAEELQNLPAALNHVRKASDEKAREYAEKYKNDPYQIWIGSGNLWGTTYSYSMCVLEESQWLRTKSVSSPEFFHGTIELIEKDVCATLLKTEAETRPLDDRVEKFLVDYTDKFTVFDTKDYELPGISEEYRGLLSPVVMWAILGRISAHLEVIRNHSLEIRRYYRKVEY
ncbi:SIS domain-containing protein [Clostridium beijerinckii]|uniref:Fructoselysine-6-phosphate deglycase n=1 Tax=Clostridium beijerinckii TaxID=1520 RepID=A0AAX0B240_CLOBE|nr:SIS domain-containing protein [Clostridium beijerinckii]NRT89415.1 fructoselysine-6-phosphate deglycase [Clostridium beijerinckii]NYC74871.1 fructoselysine-6-phosphate deglycase [Clostridium beijerinckii]